MEACLRETIFSIRSSQDFEQTAMEVFKFQYENNDVYRQWCRFFHQTPAQVHAVSDIPFLPIEFFKTHKVISFREQPIDFFQSSGTSQKNTSKHYIKDFSLYEKSFMTNFKLFFGDPKEYVFIVLLPNYQQQGHSSLVYMMKNLIDASSHKESGFYPEDYTKIASLLRDLDSRHRKTILFGVTYALLEMVKHDCFQLENTIVFETGGMKGKRKPMVKEDLHRVLKKGFGVSSITSEYGMCELFSQAYSKGDGIFHTPPQMRVTLRDINDPFSPAKKGKTGGINIIDLANVDSCAFIATQDLGRYCDNGGFELMGRFDHSDIRGCNLLYPEYKQWKTEN